MQPWLDAFRAAAQDITRVLDDLPTRIEREPVIAAGEGGDDTTAIDDAAERAVVARLEELHRSGQEFTLVSEELGERVFGSSDLHVVVDPIDGSVNAKRGLRNFCLSIAVAEGETMGDVVFRARLPGLEGGQPQGGGARLDGRPLGAVVRRHGGDPRKGRSPRRSPTTPRRLSATRSGSGSWARSPCHCASSPPAGWTRSALSARCDRSTRPPRTPDPRGRPVDRFADAGPWDGAPLDARPHGVLVAARMSYVTA